MVISETSFYHDACNNYTMAVRDFAEISYGSVVLYIEIMEVRDFLPYNITPNPA